MPKKTLAFLTLLWLLCLVVPATRYNLGLLLFHPDPKLWEREDGLDGPPAEYQTGDMDTALLEPDKQRLALLDEESYRPLMANLAGDPAAMAWWLLPSSDSQNGSQRYGDPGSYDIGETKGFISLAETAHKADPGNAFFPAEAAEGDLQLGSAGAALRDLRLAVSCPRYDDYSERFYSDALTQVHPGQPPSETYYLLWGRPRPSEACGFPLLQFAENVEAAPATATNSDFETCTLLLRLGLIRRKLGRTASCRYQGTKLAFWMVDFDQLECAASNPALPLPGEFPHSAFTSSPLVAMAKARGREDIVKLAGLAWNHARSDKLAVQPPISVGPMAEAIKLTETERLEKLVVRSLPFCLFLLLANGRRLRPWAEPTSDGPKWCWRGALAGLSLLGLLAAFDLVASARAFNAGFTSAGGPPPSANLKWSAPGLPVVFPPVPWFLVGLMLSALGLLSVLREQFWVGPFEANSSPAQLALSVTPYRVAAWAVLWISSMGYFVIGTFHAVTWSVAPGMTREVFNHGVPIFSPLAGGCLALAVFLPWWLARFPDRLAVRTRARYRLHYVLTGCLLGATLLFGGLELVRTYYQLPFDAAIAEKDLSPGAGT